MAIDKQRITGLLFLAEWHLLDHLGVVCDLLGVPLRATDSSVKPYADKFYPTLELIIEHDLKALTEGALFKNYDLLIYTNFFALSKAYRVGKDKFRTLYCPHGNSDKGHREVFMERFADEDTCLIYGQQMIDFLDQKGVTLSNMFVTGNYRYQYYLDRKEFYDTLFAKEVLSQFAKKQTTILYAPTWQDVEDNSSFFEGIKSVIGTLPDHYNLFVKLHPHLREQALAMTCHYEERYSAWDNVVFVTDWTPIYPLLNAVDIYLGDLSSIGYDFLCFNRPMFFFNPHKMHYPLYNCGVDIHPEHYHTVYQQIEDNLASDEQVFSQKRQDLYRHTFAENPLPISDVLASLDLHVLQENQ